jgi:hypothetical protein
MNGGRLHRPARRAQIALGFALIGAILLTACGKAPAKRMDEAMIRRFVQVGQFAAERRDADALCAQLADDAEIRLIEVRFSSSELHDYDKPRWCDFIRRAYAALPAGVAIRTATELTSLEIAADGQSAELRMNVTETIQVGGQELHATSRQRASIALIDGKPRYTRVSARVSGKR